MRNNRLDAQLLGLEEWQRNFVLSAFRKNIEHFEPVSHVVAHPFPNDILEWHYVLEGSEGTPFAGFLRWVLLCKNQVPSRVSLQAYWNHHDHPQWTIYDTEENMLVSYSQGFSFSW
ncbi:uncharacterized protein LOC111281374 isoform X5 [Durio zibethinus]|uniref:Uncharacterized protein LOC111281374 isoform X5 n=1 Tax=Durio zibethinus TaxID=66656 RepID=A0A6P5X8V8_DURZI|nr:uncharacterized protein LOC111281374 isoform X5 [Durio zibethinus]